MQPSRLLALLALLTLWAMPLRAELALVMGEQAGCPWCARWDAEIATAYAKTPEGRAAPLRRVDIRAPLPDDLDLAEPIRITPTFILTDDGREIDRREGYPGAEFFWPVLGEMLDDAAETVPELAGWRERD